MVVKENAPAAASAGNVRDRVLSAATRLFAAHGFDGTPLQAIADAVGVTKPAVIHHFPSKEALHASVLEQLLSRWNDVLPRILLAATAGEDRFDAITQEMVGFFRADPDRARLLMREVLDRPSEMRKLLAGYVRPWVGAIAEYIRKGQRTGEIPAAVDPEAYVLNVIILVLGGVASLDCATVLLTGANSDHSARYVGEMLRVARASLFSTMPPGENPPVKNPLSKVPRSKDLPPESRGAQAPRRARRAAPRVTKR